MIHRNPTKPVRKCRADAKWALVYRDRVYPMPRRKLNRELVLAQLGESPDCVLVRDLDGEFDQLIPTNAEVDLALGNVFKVLEPCTTVQTPPCDSKSKLAFIVDDHFEISLASKQSFESLIGLFNLPNECLLFRDLESPTDEAIGKGETVCFEDGSVFTVERNALVVILVNDNDVKLKPVKITALELKAAAIEQGVKIDLGCVLFAKKPDGSLGPAIQDGESIKVKSCLAFWCVAPDDNS